jgi:hypothetical protein
MYTFYTIEGWLSVVCCDTMCDISVICIYHVCCVNANESFLMKVLLLKLKTPKLNCNFECLKRVCWGIKHTWADSPMSEVYAHFFPHSKELIFDPFTWQKRFFLNNVIFEAKIRFAYAIRSNFTWHESLIYTLSDWCQNLKYYLMDVISAYLGSPK